MLLELINFYAQLQAMQAIMEANAEMEETLEDIQKEKLKLKEKVTDECFYLEMGLLTEKQIVKVVTTYVSLVLNDEDLEFLESSISQWWKVYTLVYAKSFKDIDEDTILRDFTKLLPMNKNIWKYLKDMNQSAIIEFFIKARILGKALLNKIGGENN